MEYEIYSRTLVSYVDILGFADLISKSRTDVSQVGRVAAVLSTLKERSSHWSRIHRAPSGEPEKIFSSLDFSDHIVRCTRIAEDANVSDLIDSELFFLGDLQLKVAEYGVLLRGGVCVGDIFFKPDDTIVFGPALVRAYELERDHAVYPRIVIDRNLILEMRQLGGDQHWENYLAQSDDGVYFLNYLHDWSATGFTIPQAPDPLPRIRAHRMTIMNAISDHPNERAMRKLMWIARYHNVTVQEVLEQFAHRFSGEDPNNYLIPDDFLQY
jgi:hypothetical protein